MLLPDGIVPLNSGPQNPVRNTEDQTPPKVGLAPRGQSLMRKKGSLETIRSQGPGPGDCLDLGKGEDPDLDQGTDVGHVQGDRLKEQEADHLIEIVRNLKTESDQGLEKDTDPGQCLVVGLIGDHFLDQGEDLQESHAGQVHTREPRKEVVQDPGRRGLVVLEVKIMQCPGLFSLPTNINDNNNNNVSMAK